MKKLNIVLFTILLGTTTLFGQVKDISVTLSPAVEYTFWDDKSGLEDGLLFGGKVGFGFGEYIELRATYMQGLDLTTNFENFGLSNYSKDLFISRDVNLTRWGGEFKANFGTKTKLNPYFTLGSGVQTIQLEDFEKQEQIFATLGLGAKFNIGKRAVFALEAKNTMYNFNAGARLLTDADKTTFSVTDADFENERLSNWSAMASLQFYLGGRKPGALTELDKAYLNGFSSGFRGLRLVFEPGLANIKFDDKSNYRDTWMLGGYVGLDFNNYVGLRGFYYKSTKDEQISTDFDELSMYGAEFRARLNIAKGIAPYLALGGGYLNTSNDYLGKDGLAVDGSYFASGGIGLNIPLATGLQAYGGIKALLTSNSNEEDLQSPDQIQTHTMYNFGLKISIGKRAKSASSVYNENLNNALNEQQAKNDEKLAILKSDYKAKIAQLESDLNTANQNQDVDKAVELLEEKKETEEALKKVEEVEKVATTSKKAAVEVAEKQKVQLVIPQKQQIEQKQAEEVKAIEKDATTSKMAPVVVAEKQIAQPVVPQKQQIEQKEVKEPLVQMTPVEFELLIQRILNEVEYNSIKQTVQPNQIDKDEQIRILNERIKVLETRLLQGKTSEIRENTKAINTLQPALEEENDDKTRQILDKLDELNRKIERNSDKIDSRPTETINPQTIIVKPGIESSIPLENQDEVAPVTEKVEVEQIQDEEEENMEVNDEEVSIFSKLTFQDLSIFGGIMFGDATMPVTGVRANFGIDNSKILFVPELFFGFSDPVSFGLSANGIIPINVNSTKISPYAGAGLGFMRIEDTVNLNANLIVGTSMNVLNGKLYIDFTTRNFLKYNQVSVGYKFSF